MAKEKICPLMSRAVTVNLEDASPPSLIADMRYEFCAKENCQFWTGVYTTEGILIWDCAFVQMAAKNSSGQVRV